jgi:hypothetical protein
MSKNNDTPDTEKELDVAESAVQLSANCGSATRAKAPYEPPRFLKKQELAIADATGTPSP